MMHISNETSVTLSVLEPRCVQELAPRSNRQSWIVETLRTTQGRLDVNRHVMDVYRGSLEAYFHATPFRRLGRAEDIVAGFFADRLGKNDYFTRWQTSGKRLQHWLVNSFRFYLLELCDKERRNRRYVNLPELLEDKGVAPGDMADSIVAWKTVYEALNTTHEHCQKRRLEQHWDIFELHELEGISYQALGKRFDMEASRATNMARTVRLLFKASVRKLVRKSGARENEIDSEIKSLISTLSTRPSQFEER